ncbi:MAG TPA: hypothetical protein VFT43_11425 [Candidatus Polarisedimenticolia bacterium]|nr:hypothetical protein [Candidatus Polarisedimenticolia bacterium]
MSGKDIGVVAAGSLLVAGLVLARVAGPQEHDHPAPPDEKLGTVRFTTSCAAAAQPAFTRAVALLHSFAFGAATEAFNQALGSDPGCAMAQWGIALCAWGNPFAAGIKDETQLQQGLDAIGRARTIGAKTGREKEYIEAAARLFQDSQSVDQRTRLLAYRDAMAQVAARHPDDSEASIFHALALAISADPKDKSYASQLKAGAILEKLWAVQPDHPGIAHYLIHAYDVPSLAPRALDAARRYAKIAPSAPHALHMPSHTFTRLGLWQESIDANLASAAAARRERSTSEELHATDYLMYAYLQTGQDRAARTLLDSLPEIASRFNPGKVGTGAPPAAGYFAIAALPARYALERGAWDEAARLVVHDSPFPFTDAMTHYARALGAARSGDTVLPKAALVALEQLRDRLAQKGEAYWSEQVEIERRTAAAWLRFAEGKRDEALSAMREAAQREDATEKNAMTPGPLAPARELLGEMLLELHEPTLALREFEKTLVNEPGRFRALAGAVKAAGAAGERETARKYFDQLRKTCERADRPGRLDPVDPDRAASSVGR